MKNFLMIPAVMTVLLLMPILFTPTYAENAEDDDPFNGMSDHFDYEPLEDGTVVITGYHGFSKHVTIPAELDGKRVTRIGNQAFSGLSLNAIPTIWTVTVPDGVTDIGDRAFLGCINLTNVVIPDSVAAIRTDAFSLCPYLTLIVLKGSAAEQYCVENGLEYDYYTEGLQLNDDMKRAAQALAESVFVACAENEGIVGLRVRLGLFYDHEVMGIDRQEGSVPLYSVLDDDRLRIVFDHAWSAHCGERTYYDEFETLVAQALRDKGCPPVEFIHPEGQAGKLLQKRNELWSAIGDRREIGEILEAILPVWSFPDAGTGMALLEAGSYDFFNAGEFTVSWTWQEEDENSDEYYQLRIELCYAADETNRSISECDWLDDPSVDLGNAVRSTAAYQWAAGKKAVRISVMIEGT